MKRIVLCLALAGCVIDPFAPTVDAEDVEPAPPKYCDVRVYTSWVTRSGYPVLVTDSVHYVGCDGRVRVVTP